MKQDSDAGATESGEACARERPSTQWGILSRVTRLVERPWRALNSSPLSARLTRGTVWALASIVAANGFPLLSGILIARMLGQNVYGDWGMIACTIGMFASIAQFDLGATASKHLAELRSADAAKAARILDLMRISAVLTGGLGALVLIWRAPTLIHPSLSCTLSVGSIAVFFMVSRRMQNGAFAGLEAFKGLALASLYTGSFSFVFTVIGCLYHGLQGAVWGLGLGVGLSCLVNHRALSQEAAKQRIRPWAGGWVRELPILWRFSLPSMLGGMLAGPVQWLVQFALYHQPDGDAQLAVFRVGLSWSMIVSALPLPFCHAFLPILSSIADGDGIDRKKLILRAIVGGTLVAGTAAGLLVVSSGTILAMYGPGFIDGQHVFSLLACSGVLEAISAVLLTILLSLGLIWWRLLMLVLWATVVGVVTFRLVPFYAGIGGAMGLLIGNCCLLAGLLCILLVKLAARGAKLGGSHC